MSDGPQIGSYDPKNLEGRADGEGNNSFRPREFFWDSVTLYVVSAIIGLAAIDVVTEFLRGSASIACTTVGVDVTDQQADYINGICSQNLPRTEIFPTFIVVHGILLLIPHYLWLNHYGGSFDFFFSQTSQLDRLRSENTGKYSDKNRLILQQLTAAFSTYKQNWMFVLYVLKLAFQLFISLAGFFIAVFVFTDFRDTFFCNANSTSTEFWPLGQDDRAMCVFTSLRLFALLRIADLILVSLLILCFMWSLLWSTGVHPTELGTGAVARFVFEAGMLPEHYISNFRIGWCCEPCRRFLYWLFALFPLLSLRGPRIITNLDFLVMKLFRTDSGLGFVFRELQVLKKVEQINADERRIVTLHRRQQMAPSTDDEELIDNVDVEADLKWRMEREPDKTGLFEDEYEYEQLSRDKPLCIPNSFRGAVLGFSNCAPTNSLALYLTFGSPSMGVATALARVFGTVGIVNFNPYYKVADPKKPITLHVYSDIIYEFVVPVDVMSSKIKATFKGALWSMWKSQSGAKAIQASFITIGPLDKPHYKSTVSLFLAEVASTRNLADNCVLVTAHPEEVGGKRTGRQFYPYAPPKKNFQMLAQSVHFNQEEILAWPPTTNVPPTSPQLLKTMTKTGLLLSLECGSIRGQFSVAAFFLIPRPPGFPRLVDNSDSESSATSEESASNESSNNSLVPLVPTQPTATVPGQADVEMKPVTTGGGGEHTTVSMEEKA